MNSSLDNNTKNIEILEVAINENKNRIKQLEQLLQEKEDEIEILKKKLMSVKASPRTNIVLSKNNSHSLIENLKEKKQFFKMDVIYAFELLKREGFMSFLNRAYWYIRGERLIEEIHAKKKSKYVTEKNK